MKFRKEPIKYCRQREHASRKIVTYSKVVKISIIVVKDLVWTSYLTNLRKLETDALNQAFSFSSEDKLKLIQSRKEMPLNIPALVAFGKFCNATL